MDAEVYDLSNGEEEKSRGIQCVEREEAEEEEVEKGGKGASPGFGDRFGSRGGRGGAASTTTSDTKPSSEASNDDECAYQAYQGAGAAYDQAVEVEFVVCGLCRVFHEGLAG